MALDRDNSFELIKELGAGGFGTTYQARIVNPKLLKKLRCEDIVVLKMPNDEDSLYTLSEEYGLNSTIKNVCSSNELDYFCEVYATLQFNSSYGTKQVMVMKYMPEGNLRNKIELEGISLDSTIAYIRDILCGLHIMHRTRILHRDIKPENILFLNGKPRITDLGIGKALHSKDYAVSKVGTLCYMSPELLMGEKGATYNTDIWSLGVMFHEMLFGCLPFGITEDFMQGQIVNAILNSDLCPPETNDVPEEIHKILQKSLIKDYKKRYQSAKEMLDDIEKFEVGNLKESADYKRFIEKKAVKDFGNAIKILEELIDRYPKSAELYLELGRMVHIHSGTIQALEIFDKGIQAVPDCGNLYFEAGILSNEIHDKNKTLQYLKQSMEIGIPERKNLIIAQTLIKNLTGTV